MLNQRRREECKEFQENIKNVDSEDKFYALDIDWYLQWKCFVTNDMTDKTLNNTKKKISPNKNIGVLPPGPITNSNLFDKNIKEFSLKSLKKGLKKVKIHT
jgi:hypothetical protein